MNGFKVGTRVAKACTLVAATLSFATAPAPAQTPATLSPARIAEIAIPSVVLIRTSTGLGSGFVVSADGKIVTNFHVIRGADEAIIVTSDKVEHKDVSVLAVDKTRDLAVLKIGARGLKALTLADSGRAKPGEHVVAIGNPAGLGDTVSDGLLSGVREFPDATVLQISAPISPGSSGGPVLNDQGQVIGVSTFVLDRGQNLNFAIPINAVKPLLAGNVTKPLTAYVVAAPRRNIPQHPRSLLNGCPVPQLRATLDAIGNAINVGAPLYNEGNIEACYRIYEGAALEVQRGVRQCSGPKRALADGVANAQKLSSWNDKAWAMRDAFDGILALVTPGGRAPGTGDAIERHVPLVSASVMDGCPSKDVAAITATIEAAIGSGAPLYDSGNTEACYRIYAGAVEEIDRKFPGCRAMRGVLGDGARRAQGLTGFPAKGWALRDAFDGLGAAIASGGPRPSTR